MLALVFIGTIVLGVNQYLPPVFNAVILSAAVIFAFANYGFFGNNTLLKICGKYCLAIYVMHIYFTAGTRILMRIFHVENFWLYLGSGIALAVVGSIVIYKFCEHYSCLSFVFKPMAAWKKYNLHRR